MGDSCKVLLVDDERDIRDVAETALTLMGGYEVTTASSAQEGLEILESFKPDVILLDVMMPAMDGPVALQHIRQMPQLDSVPVIFLTARIQRDEIESYRSAGAAGVINKPFDPMHLHEKLERIRNSSHFLVEEFD